MIEKWKKCLDKKGPFSALLTGLFNAFDYLPHKPLLTNLNAYGFDESSLNYMKNYLSDQKKRVEINNSLSNWTNILYEVTQGSVSGPNLFNNFFFVICFCFYLILTYPYDWHI